MSSEKQKYIYIGLTKNLERRINQHQKGRERTTRQYKPFRLLFSKELPTRIAARTLEKYLKSGVGREYLKKIQ